MDTGQSRYDMYQSPRGGELHSAIEAFVIRESLASAIKRANEDGDQRSLATLRLIQTALKERDLEARRAGRSDGIPDDDLVGMLRTMVEQRQQHRNRCECSARLDEAEQEQGEIEVIEQLLPPPLCEDDMARAVDACIDETGACKLKDTGRVMSRMRELYSGRFDPVKARRMLGTRLA